MTHDKLRDAIRGIEAVDLLIADMDLIGLQGRELTKALVELRQARARLEALAHIWEKAA